MHDTPTDQIVEETETVNARRDASPTNPRDLEATPEPELPVRDPDWPLWTIPLLAAMRLVPDLSRAAQEAGVNRSTAQRLALRSESFAAALADARDVALDRLERLMYQRASTGRPMQKTVTRTFKDGTVETIVTDEVQVSDVLAIFYTKRWRPEYRDTYRVEQTGAGGGPIRIETERKLDEAAERLDAEVVRLADARAARDAASG